MAVSVDEINELTLRGLAERARDRLMAGSQDILDTLLVVYGMATPEQRQAFVDCLFGDSATEVDRCR